MRKITERIQVIMIFALFVLFLTALFALIRTDEVYAYDLFGPGQDKVIKTSDLPLYDPHDLQLEIKGDGTIIIDEDREIEEIIDYYDNSYTVTIEGKKTLKPLGYIRGNCLKLVVNSGNIEMNNGTIYVGNLTINGGTIEYTARNNADIFSINDYITVNGGKLVVNSENDSDGIKAGDGIIIKGGEVSVNSSQGYAIVCRDMYEANIKISGGKVDATGALGAICSLGNINISGSNTEVVAKTTTNTGAIRINPGHQGIKGKISVISPAAIITPVGGKISMDKDYIAESDGEKATEVVIKSLPVAGDKKRIYVRDDESGKKEDDKPAVVKPDSLVILKLTGLPAGTILAKQEQGPAAMSAFNAALPAGFKSAFTFNMITNGKEPDNTLKKGSFTMLIPAEYRKPGRTFALLALDKDGKVLTLPDKDTDPVTITVDVDLEGYAFDLIYMD